MATITKKKEDIIPLKEGIHTLKMLIDNGKLDINSEQKNDIYLMIFLWVLNAIYKYLRSGAYVSSNFRFPKFYLFIYLCTLELMPLLLIYKIIMGFRY